MQTGVCLSWALVCQLNADVLSNSSTQSFRHISYNDMTYKEPALMHHRGEHRPYDPLKHTNHTRTSLQM